MILYAVVGLVCLSAGACVGVLVAGLLMAARCNSEAMYERRSETVAVVDGDGGDAVGDHSVEL